jgi:hypothetical protein
MPTAEKFSTISVDKSGDNFQKQPPPASSVGWIAIVRFLTSDCAVP